MKRAIANLRCLILASILLTSCNTNSDDKKGGQSVDDPKKANIATLQDKASSELASEPSQSSLPIVKANTSGNKYVDWGTKPVKAEDGPADTWTMPHMMCQGPPFLEGQLKASSTLASQGQNDYSVNNVSDDDPTTAWVEGKSDYGLGEFLELIWIPMSDGEISILNGYQSSKSVWENNSRVKTMKVSVGGKELAVIELADVMGVQKFKIPDLVVSTKKGYEYKVDGPIRFTITAIYPGLKYKDTAISGIFSCGG